MSKDGGKRMYQFKVPEQKRVRLIIHTDCKNEADDQYAVAHQLMTPKLDVRGIVAGHFDKGQNRYPQGETARASYEEVLRVLQLMHLEGRYPVLIGAPTGLADDKTPIASEGAAFIIEEAMREDDRPLYIGLQGAITDLASAILMKPEICSRMTAIWIGGGIYPQGGREFNLFQDIHAANVVFRSGMPLWQVPMDVYKQMSVTLAELQLKVSPYGKIGRYLFEQMVDFNEQRGDDLSWPHGETWGLGDQGVLTVLMEEAEKTSIYKEIEAPCFDLTDGHYIYEKGNRKIRVYHTLDSRLTLEDFFCKLQLNFPDRES